MAEAVTTPAKYVFLDVVGFTRERSVEAQVDVVQKLYAVCQQSILDFDIPDEKLICIPTGDGICLALLNVETSYDIHILLALRILKYVDQFNRSIEDKTSRKRFEVRIGINSNTDNLITDINGNRNIVGAGINMASRVMDMADGNQILVGQSVFHELQQHEKYTNAFTSYVGVVKHKLEIPVHQLIAEGHEGLNIDAPMFFREPEPVTSLGELQAYYLAYAICFREKILRLPRNSQGHYVCVAALYSLAKDSVTGAMIARSNTPSVPEFNCLLPGRSFDQRLAIFDIYPPSISSSVGELAVETYLRKCNDCFENSGLTLPRYSFVSPRGQWRLEHECPEIWKDFNFVAEASMHSPPTWAS